jgi:hypothetical protein
MLVLIIAGTIGMGVEINAIRSEGINLVCYEASLKPVHLDACDKSETPGGGSRYVNGQ